MIARFLFCSPILAFGIDYLSYRRFIAKLATKVIYINNYGRILPDFGQILHFNALELIYFISKSWSSGVNILLQHDHHGKNSSSFLLYIIALITFITILTILLSARHVHEIGIWAVQIDESIVMKVMSSSKKGMRGYTEKE